MHKGILLGIVLLVPFLCFAQDEEWSIEKISEMESLRFNQHKAKNATSEIGKSYDWNYSVCKWRIDPWQRRIEGEVVNTITLLIQTDSIDFDFSSELEVIGVFVDGEEVSEYGFSFENSFFIKSDMLQIGSSHEIRIEYEGQPRTNNYLSFNQGFHGNSIPEIWTLSQPFGAADWWPCKMSLSDKLDSIRIEITVPEGNKAASQGVLKEVIFNPDQTSTYVWIHRYPIPAYLVSIAVTNYAEFSYFAELESDTVEILNYVYPERLEEEMDRGLQIVSLMELFSDLFGEYPYASEKYGHAQASIPGGMEHSTMSTMSGLSFNLSAHELAHQWFGNKVTCGSWSDIWLNEGFATYLNGLAIEYLKPDEFDEWKAARISSITRQPDGSVFVEDTLDRDRIFNGRLSYNKGAYVLHMLRWVIGDESFYEGCRNYLNEPDHSFSYAHTDEFFQIMEEVSGKDLSEFFNDWYYGEGFPNYKIHYSQADGGVVLRISQLPSHPSVDFFEMPIALRLVGEESDTTIIVNNAVQDQTYYLQTDFAVNSLEFDPDRRILALSELVIDPGLNEENEPTIQAYPNPSPGEVRFFSSSPISGLKTAEVYNLNGKLCKIIEPAGGISNGFLMDISDLNPAVYLVRFRGASDYSVRLVKME
jgi:aminopeptidase N